MASMQPESGSMVRLHFLVWTSVATLLLTLPQSRCSCHTNLDLQCNDIRSITFLYNEKRVDSPEVITCSRGEGASEYTWSLSQDGQESTAVPINTTSSDKYTFDPPNTLSISLTNITGDDEGLYRCIYGGGPAVSPELCIYVYRRAVFASCPNEFDGCPDPTDSLSVVAGESAKFNASISYTPGGPCWFAQQITRITLTKKNAGSDGVLYDCGTAANAGPCLQGDARVRLTRGGATMMEFVFTLSETVHGDDSGLYEVSVTKIHPRTGSASDLTKQFQLIVNPGPTDATALPTTDTSTAATSTAATSTEQRETLTDVAISVSTTIVLLLLTVAVLTVAMVVLMKHARSRKAEAGGGVAAHPVLLQPQIAAVNVIHRQDIDDPLPGMHQGSFIETVNLPDLPGLNSEYIAVSLSTSPATTAAANNIYIPPRADTKDLRVDDSNVVSCPSDSFLFPPKPPAHGASNSCNYQNGSQEVAQV